MGGGRELLLHIYNSFGDVGRMRVRRAENFRSVLVSAIFSTGNIYGRQLVCEVLSLFCFLNAVLESHRTELDFSTYSEISQISKVRS